MKVLHICFSDIEGGAARAAHRLHSAQVKHGINSNMLVVDKFSDDVKVYQLPRWKRLLVKFFSSLSQRILKLRKTTNLTHHSLNVFPSFIRAEIEKISPDIVHLHWIGNDMLSISEISRIKQPVVWTFHDMWAICGAEHYELLTLPNCSTSDDISPSQLNEFLNVFKKKKWENKKIHVVTPSQWLKACTEDSDVFSSFPISYVQNCLDHESFKYVSSTIARRVLGLPENKKIVLFGAMSSTSDPRKGFEYLKLALNQLPDNEDVLALVFGASSGDEDLGVSIKYMGRVHDDVTLMLMYNAADVFVGPSLQDNLPNTFAEALACGTPCIGFNIGGIPDLIINDSLGELCSEISSECLHDAIVSVLSKSYDRKGIAVMASDVRNEKNIVAQYSEVYRSELQ
ncbi:glycosyltransferase [Vibrio hyugaensis]|uniref:glycosyltransferase n=1 Tax=Vibrio hyugaensis TaxID=1534743 RepID=UPI0005EFE098|nr:glycosyltransferase [Vibrio hyugaensis]